MGRGKGKEWGGRRGRSEKGWREGAGKKRVRWEGSWGGLGGAGGECADEVGDYVGGLERGHVADAGQLREAFALRQHLGDSARLGGRGEPVGRADEDRGGDGEVADRVAKFDAVEDVAPRRPGLGAARVDDLRVVVRELLGR